MATTGLGGVGRTGSNNELFIWGSLLIYNAHIEFSFFPNKHQYRLRPQRLRYGGTMEVLTINTGCLKIAYLLDLP